MTSCLFAHWLTQWWTQCWRSGHSQSKQEPIQYKVNELAWELDVLSKTMNWETCIRRKTWYQKGCQKNRTELGHRANLTGYTRVSYTNLTAQLSGMEGFSLYMWWNPAPRASCPKYPRVPLILHACLYNRLCVWSLSHETKIQIKTSTIINNPKSPTGQPLLTSFFSFFKQNQQHCFEIISSLPKATQTMNGEPMNWNLGLSNTFFPQHNRKTQGHIKPYIIIIIVSSIR